MVGIVIVSHSAKLAEGVRELADQMVQGNVPLATAGGIDDPENPIGTDAMKVYEAIESVYSDDGVVVLMDLGSALMSAELALEFLMPEQQERVELAAAPLVEGTMAAAVQASVGGTRAQVISEAKGALAVKLAQLGMADDDTETDAPDDQPTAVDAPSITLTIENPQGLHARPAAEFVRTAAQFSADIRLHKGSAQANAKSINQVATLGVGKGDVVTVTAVGSDADAALAGIQALADNHFGEADLIDAPPAPAPEPAAAAPAVEGALNGIAASPGIAIGPAFLYRPQLPDIPQDTIDDPASEWARLETAVATAYDDLQAVEKASAAQVGAGEAAIFGAQALFLQDPDLLQTVRDRIESDHLNAAAAWDAAIDQTAATFRAMADPYMQARAADVRDVGNRVLQQLLDVALPELALDEPAIVVAADLSPSDTARMDPTRVLGICTELGGATAHSAILARALGIPAVVGLGADLWQIEAGQEIGVQGGAGQVWLALDEARRTDLQAERDAWLAEQAAAKAASQSTAVTSDGHALEIVANIGGPNDTAVALDYGAEGVGLFRTEFLYMDRDSAPTEDEQEAAYRSVAQAMGQRPVIIRTLDVGGDKPIPYLQMESEENPFLGWRGIRFCLDRPDIFKPQLRAILRASVDADGTPFNIKIMFPMIGSVAEFAAARALVAEVQTELRDANIPFDEGIEVGLMIEVPSAVAVADQLAQQADFFSIGTNDLTQYTMAADRGNAKVAGLAQALQPAVLRMIKQAVDAAHAADIWIGMCGELAGNPLATPVLVGLGLDELSMSAPAIPAVKTAVRTLTLDDARQIAAHVLELEGVTAVVDYLQSR